MLAQQDRSADWLAIGDAGLLEDRARQLDLPLKISSDPGAPTRSGGHLTVLHVPLKAPAVAGQLDVANAGYVMRTLEVAVDGCLEGAFRALVTGPVQKSLINDAGIPFSGHTEYLCQRSGVDDVLMLLVAGTLRVALATTHLPLRAVPDAITIALLERRLGLLLEGLSERFGIPDARVLVSGLNPHAGESGHLGREEIDVIAPVCEAFRRRGFSITGPLPADTLFTPDVLADADAVLVMFHDQGLPVLKHSGFGRAVNVTLGLPFIRTSVDHGTGLDRAGTGRVHSGSLEQAVALAGALR